MVTTLIIQEAVSQRCCVKKVFLEISQNSQENTCARVSILIKLQASGPQNTSGGCFCNSENGFCYDCNTDLVSDTNLS